MRLSLVHVCGVLTSLFLILVTGNAPELDNNRIRLTAEGTIPTGAILMSGIWYSFGHVVVVILLVMISGLYAGLTIGLMALDETTLQIIKNSGNPTQRRYAEKIAPIRKDGYMLLVTLLLASTIINETIPIVADRFFGAGWAAVAVATVLVLLFGEILPQAVCTKYALTIGGKTTWLVRLSMFLLYPIARPAAKLLVKLLGSDNHGAVYKRAELKELVSIMGGKIELSPEEVKIIRGVLDLRDKHPALIMTPLDQVYMVRAERLIDHAAIDEIVKRGYSRVPVYAGNRSNIIGVILVKRLLTSNMIGPVHLSALPLSSAPTVGSKQSLFTILHEFQQGKSHLAIVMDEEKGIPIGIITLEDIIEELIQEEIVDETDINETWMVSPANSVLDLFIRHSQSKRRSNP